MLVDEDIPPFDVADLVDGLVEVKVWLRLQLVQTLQEVVHVLVYSCHFANIVLIREQTYCQFAQPTVIQQSERRCLEVELLELSLSEQTQKVLNIVVSVLRGKAVECGLIEDSLVFEGLNYLKQ